MGSEPKKVNVYDIAVIDIGTNLKIKNIPVASTSSIGGNDVLIGMDIICLGDLAITNKNRKTTFTFSIPPHKELDFVERANKLNSAIIKKLQKKDF